MDKKLLIFLAIFFIFLWGYQKLILDKYAPKRPPVVPSAPAQASKPQPAQSQSQPQSAVAAPAEAPVVPSTTVKELHTTVVDTPLYRAEFVNQGAVLKSFRLKKYTDDFGKPLEMVPQASNMKDRPLELGFDDKTIENAANEAIYETHDQDISLPPGGHGSVVFLYADRTYVFRKEFDFDADKYMIHSAVEAKRGGQPVNVRITWAPGLETPKGYKDARRFQPSRGVVNNGEKVEHWNPKKTPEFRRIAATIRWAGVETNYFMSVFIPDGSSEAFMGQSGSGEDKKNQNILLEVAGQQPGELKYRLFVGPKDYDLLKSLGMDLQDAIDFGFFAPIAKILFVTLKFLYRYMGNYGLAILLLTVIVKILFTPFVQKSFESQRKMQQMQPELKKIQEKYAKMRNDDPRKQSMNTEVMQLHKRYGVNPLGGCLPLLIQMPVLYAFWRLLSNSIELRKAPFYWWIQDLSAADPYRVLPILMGASMILQQKMTPISDPTQKTMMYMMPIMFTFISMNLQSGLVLYWLFSNVLAIAHQYYFQRQQKPPVAGAPLVVKEPNA